MRFGVLPPYRAGVAADPDWMTSFAVEAERLGYDSLYTVEHVVVPTAYEERYPYSDTGRMPLPEDCPIPDPLDLLAFLAGRTERILLGTGVVVGPHHHPLVLAKRLSTIDRLSGGRMLLGVGVGWMREELESTGIDFSTRGRRLDEVLAAMRAVWCDVPASFHGEFFDFDQMRSEPRPVRPGGVPIHIGGHSEAAARRAGRLADGFHPLGLDDETLAARWQLVRTTAEDAGRDPDTLELCTTVYVGAVDEEAVERAAAVGVSRIVCSTASADWSRLSEELAAAAERVGLTPA
jgi:probable F420-dependent oxidoreductase